MTLSCQYRALDDASERRVNALPLFEQLTKDALAVARKAVKTFVALFLFTPFADEEPLALQTAEKRIEGIFVDRHTKVGEGFAQCVSIALGAELCQDGQNEAAPAKL